MRDGISAAVRLLVASRAARRCEYCLLHEDDSFTPHQIDHIISRKHGGNSSPDNLALACIRCNAWKGSDIASFGFEPDRISPLFHPRHDLWQDHFRLEAGDIVPLTAAGAATVRLPRLNLLGRVTERRVLIQSGRLSKERTVTRRFGIHRPTRSPAFPRHLRPLINNLHDLARPPPRAHVIPVPRSLICQLQPSLPSIARAINRANSQHSTGPRTESGKQRSSLNALRHGLTAASAVLPSEDPAAYENHRRQFFDEYQPATATETQLVQELVDTSWRLNRIPLLEAEVLARAANPPSEQAAQSTSTSSTPTASSTTSASNPNASPASSKKPSTNSAKSRPTAASASAATSKTPPPSSNSINTKEFPGSPPIMASFFQKTKSNASPNA